MQPAPQHALTTSQLIYTRGVNIFVDEQVLNLLLENFDPNKRLSVLVVSGKVGTGKSSFLNVILKRLYGDLNNTKRPFDVQTTSNTLTQGVWISPHPYIVQNHPDVQLLIVDLEGMFGLKKGNKEDTELNLMKIYLFGMLISSVFTLHAMNKIDSETISILKRAFDICRKLQQGLNVEPPELYLLMKDIDLNDNHEDIQETLDKIEYHLEDYERERARLHIRGRGRVPSSFEKSNSKNCSELPGTKYLAVVDELITATAQHVKVSPVSTQNNPITIRDFGNLVRSLCQLLNEKDMEAQLVTAIDFVKVEKMNQIYNEHLQRCVDECRNKATTEPVETSIDTFKEQVAARINQHVEAFKAEVINSLRKSETISIWIEKQTALFRATTKAMNVIEVFGQRKVVAEQNEAQRRVYQEQLDQEKAVAEAAKLSMINLQNRMDEQTRVHNEDLLRIQNENEAKLLTLAREKLEELNKRIEADARHRDELAGVQKAHADGMAIQTQKWTEKWDELVRQQTALREQEERAREEIKRASQEEKERLLAIMAEDRERHRVAVDNLSQQLRAVLESKARKKKKRGPFSFITQVVAKPLETLANGIVKSLI